MSTYGAHTAKLYQHGQIFVNTETVNSKDLNLDQNFQNKLLMDVISQHFDEADDLVRYVQNRTGKLDSSVITTYWLAQEHMLRDKTSLAKYIKFECER